MKKSFLFIFFILVFMFLKSQSAINIAFYNCENFFDTVDNPKINDNEFLPNAQTKWDTKKYLNKIKKTAQVLDSTVLGIGLPDVMGFCEIENVTVLNDLIKLSQLKARKYKAFASTGVDERGINVGLIYDEDLFTLITNEEVNATNYSIADYKTRNILHVQLIHKTTKETFSFFVNHWPSRRDGEEKTEPKRLFAAQQLKNKINELENKNSQLKIICMGDFNDTPTNSSVAKILDAVSKPKTKNQLFNPFAELALNGKGSHYHSGNWQMFDQIILNQNCLNGKNFTFKKGNAFVLDKEFVLFENYKTGEKKPNRTYGFGNKYYNGYSDHLAVYLILN